MQVLPVVVPQTQPGAAGGNAPAVGHVPIGGNVQTLAHLQQVTFAPFGGDDVFSQCAAKNISRKVGKDFVPIVPNTQATKVALEQGKAAMLAEYAQKDANSVQEEATTRQHIAQADQGLARVNALRQNLAQRSVPPTAAELQQLNDLEKLALDTKAMGQNSLQTIADNRVKWAKMTQAAQNTDILAPERKLSELPANATVHLPGHGTANYPYLTSVQNPTPAQRFSLKQVALELQTGGLT
jgi:hypothetical protein